MDASSLLRVTRFLIPAAVIAPVLQMSAQPPRAARPRPQDTEVYQPAPPVVTPAATVGMPPSDAVVLFDGKPVASITADAQGNFVSSIDVPPGTPAGAHTVTVKGSVCELSIRVNVLGALASTGAGNDTRTTVLVAISVLVAGLVLVVGSRRRRSSGSVSQSSRPT